MLPISFQMGRNLHVKYVPKNDPAIDESLRVVIGMKNINVIFRRSFLAFVEI